MCFAVIPERRVDANPLRLGFGPNRATDGQTDVLRNDGALSCRLSLKCVRAARSV